jgi:hypothetical protein
MDGLIVIWSVMLSNHIAATQLPECVVASYHRSLRGRARGNGFTPMEEQGQLRANVARRNLGIISELISFERTPKTILKYY